MSKNNEKSSVCEAELKRFTDLAAEWWDINGPLKTLHSFNSIRVPFVCNGLIKSGVIKLNDINSPNILKNVKILDIGCGGGILSEALARLDADVTGLDPSKELIEMAKIHAADNSLQINYVCSTIEEHSELNQGKYDAVIASEVIEHIEDQKTFLQNCIKCLKPGGSFFMTVFNRTILSWIIGIILLEYILNIIPRGTHNWKQFIKPSEVADILKDDCSTFDVVGVKFIFWRNKFETWKYSNVGYMLQAVKNNI